MKFQPVRQGELRAYSNPFTFWLFVHNDSCDIVAHYGAHTETHNFSNQDEAEAWAYKYALSNTLTQLQEIAPEGGRTDYIDYEYKFVCNGAIPDMGWYCCMPIGHKGKCWTRTKNTDFEREN